MATPLPNKNEKRRAATTNPLERDWDGHRVPPDGRCAKIRPLTVLAVVLAGSLYVPILYVLAVPALWAAQILLGDEKQIR